MKRTLKKSLSIVLSFILVMSAVCSTALISIAADGFAIEDGVLTKYYGTASSITIPDSVTSIGVNAFENCTGLTGVTIPNSVTTIQDFAFNNCSALTGIIIPDSVTSIGDGAFESCTALTSITISSSVTSIGNVAFSECTGLSAITISPDNKNYSSENGVLFDKGKTTLIQYPAASPMTNYTIPSEVTFICSSAFQDCTALASVDIPAGVTEISNGAFMTCPGLLYFTVSEDNRNYTSESGVLFNKDKTNLIQYPAASPMANYTIPNGVTSISGFAFDGCVTLSGIAIPAGVTEIHDGAFTNCTSLLSITVDQSNSKYSSVNGVLFDKNKFNLIQYPIASPITNYTIPDGVTNIFCYAFESAKHLTTVTIPSSVKSINYDAFRSCTGLTSITIPNSVTSINDEAFENCTGLTSIAISENVTSINYKTFKNCTGLASITIPNSITYIGADAFETCTGLTSITIPNSVTEIDDEAFCHCTNLTNATISRSITDIIGSCFNDTAIYNDPSNWVNNVLYIDHCLIKANTALSGSCAIEPNTRCIARGAFNGTGLTSATIPSSVTSICCMAFNDTPLYLDGSNWVNNVLYVDHCLIEAKDQISGSYVVEQNTKCIAESAFDDCTDLTDVTIQSGVSTIGNCAFNNCNHLTSITIPNSVTSIGYCAFNNCNHLTSITIPNSVTSIGYYAFCDCSRLASITIPNGVTSIDYNAFSYCLGLTSATISSSVTSMGSGIFAFCPNLANITVDQNNLNYSSKDGILFNKDQTALVYYPDGRTETSYTIPNNVTSIKSFAFTSFDHLANVTIPNTVTEIEDSAIYWAPSGFAVQCTANSAAYFYAVTNSIDHTIVNIMPADKAVIDYKNNKIYSDHRLNKNLGDLISYTESGLTMQATASLTGGGNSYYGTGSVIKLYDGSTLVSTYTVVSYGDLNGDSVCDAMDAMAAALMASGHVAPNQDQIAAANAEASGKIDGSAYQYIVNKALSA